jgi:hypothetical protein
MATGAPPLFGTSNWLVARQSERDPASHGIDLAMELQIAARSGEIPDTPGGGAPRRARLARAWGWLHSLSFVGHKS